MFDAAISPSWSRQGGSLLPSTQKKRKSQTSRRRKKEQPEVTLWFCCFCGHGGMTHKVPACDICSNRRCSLCHLEKFQVGWKEQKQTFYTWTKDAALRKEAALLGLTTAEPDLIQPPELRNATTAITRTTLEPDSTCGPVSLQEGLPSVTTPVHVTLQSLNEHDPHSHGDTRVSPTARARKEFGLSSLSLDQVDAVDIASDPSSLAWTAPEQVPDWQSSLPHQTDTIDTIIVIFNRWRAEGSHSSHGSSSPTTAAPPSSSQPNQSTTPERSRKRTSDQRNSSKQSGAKRPKISNDAGPQVKKEDRRLLACPFWKKDPVRHRDCFRGVKRIRDVKQHLRRSHQQPVFCPICGLEFGDEQSQLSEHLRAAERCQRREFLEPDGMNAERQKGLKRYSDRNADERQQWYVIWDYVFPGGHNGKPPPPRPSSPYVDQDLSEEMLSFLEFSHRDGWGILANDPSLSDVALQIDEEMLQRCLDRIHDTWLAKRSTASQQLWEESPLTLSDFSSPDERTSTSHGAIVDHQQGDGNMMTLNDSTVDLAFGNNFPELEIDFVFDEFLAIPTVDDNMAQPFTSIPLLTYDLVVDQEIKVATLDPTLINR